MVPTGVPDVADPMLNESKSEVREVDVNSLNVQELLIVQIVQELLKQEILVELKGLDTVAFAFQAQPGLE